MARINRQSQKVLKYDIRPLEIGHIDIGDVVRQHLLAQGSRMQGSHQPLDRSSTK